MLNFNSIAGKTQSQPLYRTCTPVVGSVVVGSVVVVVVVVVVAVVVVVVVKAWRLELTRRSP